MICKFVRYYRVSSLRQGRSGLGLTAQRRFAKSYLESLGPIDYLPAPEHVETKGGTSIRRRPKLKTALETCQSTGATLLIARLSRLRRDATFLFNLHDSGVKFIACDMPEVDRAMIKVMAIVAANNGELISARTKTAAAAAKARGSVGAIVRDKPILTADNGSRATPMPWRPYAPGFNILQSNYVAP